MCFISGNMKNRFCGIEIVLLLTLLTEISRAKEGSHCEDPQPQSHPCQRPCVLNETMTCYYTYEIDHYYALGKACYGCPTNITDCYRTDCVPLDGVARTILTVNRQVPGPSIEVCENDNVVVHVVNKLEDAAVSIHWHGWYQTKSPHMDGVPFVTQCPIYPNSDFRYVMEATDVGTSFWHSHSGMQRADGLFGALVVRAPPENCIHYDLYDVDEHVVIVNDWSHSIGVDKQQQYYQVDGANAGESFLINGKGRYYNNSLALTKTPLEVLTVKRGLRHRIRIISAGIFDCPFQLYIDNHNFTVIAADGEEIKPVRADALIVYAAERWDIILDADQPVGNYWIRITGETFCEPSHQVAILHYDGASHAEPEAPVGYNVHPEYTLEINSITEDDLVREKSLLVSDLVSWKRDSDLLKENPDKTVVLAFNFNALDNPKFHMPGYYGYNDVVNQSDTPQLNHLSFLYPDKPFISQYDEIDPSTFCSNRNLSLCESENTTLYCECTHIIEIPLNSVVELILLDLGPNIDAIHPLHLHGYAFAVVARGHFDKSKSVADLKKLDWAGVIKRNLVNPIMKDTVGVSDVGYVMIRFKADNPGFWFFHCHLELHLGLGMAVVFKVGELKDMIKTPVGFPTCGDFHNKDSKTPL